MSNDKITDALIYGTPIISASLCVVAAVTCPFIVLKAVFLGYAVFWDWAFFDVMTEDK